MSSVLDKLWSEQFREAATSVYTIIAAAVVVVYLIFKQTRTNRDTYDEQDYRDAGHTIQMEPLSGLVLTRKLLEEFNCTNKGRRYLVALRDVVYDVSNVAEDFGPKGCYAKWSGQELTELIKAEAIRKNENIETHMQHWTEALDEFFFVAGELIDFDPDETATEEATRDATVEDVIDDEDDRPARGDSRNSMSWDDNNMTIIPNN